MYAHVPSVTTYPVYLGDLDKVLGPFVATGGPMPACATRSSIASCGGSGSASTG